MNRAAAIRSYKRFVAREKKEILRTRRAFLGLPDEDEEPVVVEQFPRVFAWERQIVVVNGEEDVHVEQDDEALVVEQVPVAALVEEEHNAGLVVIQQEHDPTLVVVAPKVEEHVQIETGVVAPNMEETEVATPLAEPTAETEKLFSCIDCSELINASTVPPSFYISCRCKSSLVPCTPEDVNHALVCLIKHLQNKVPGRGEIDLTHRAGSASNTDASNPVVELEAKYSFDTGELDSSSQCLSICESCVNKKIKTVKQPIFSISISCKCRKIVACPPTKEAEIKVSGFLLEYLQSNLDYLGEEHEDS